MLLLCTAVQFGTSERKSFGSVREFGAQIIWFSSGTSERESFGSVRDFRAQSANYLIKFGTSERRAQII